MGRNRATIPDAVDGAGNLYEMKGGVTPVSASYQIRLQIFAALRDGVDWNLVTDRPLTGSLERLIDDLDKDPRFPSRLRKVNPC